MFFHSSFVRPYTLSTYIAGSLIVALLMWVSGVPYTLLQVEAAQISDFSDTLSTSALGVGANHTISFVSTSGVVDDGSTIVITMPAGFDIVDIVENDVDIADDGTDLTTGTACGSVEAAVSTSSQDIIIEICNGAGGAIAAASVVTIEIGTNATASGTGANQVINHAIQDSYVLSVGGTMGDVGDTRLVVLDNVTVTAAINTIFDFSVNGVDPGVTVNDDATVTSGTSTATSVPFGILAPNVPRLVAQELRVDTNAPNGFAVTVEANQTLTAGNGATIDEFTDGLALASTTVWAAPAGTIGSTDTYGHWGLTTDDDAVSGASSTQWGIGEATYRGDFVGNPVEVFYHNGPVINSAGVGVGSTTVAYKVEIMELQEAAKDYTATLMYIATPVF